ncbi:hypothetical protein E3A20_13910 [Planctomyces bekefii]|uniref:Uncharacterized protein n=1 Tax=Planctomyces bekefii TaxID=1653850 RepID=A0A5C6M5C6_9PLAN|nr:hypothetical protein E3A20_13910 [Planctomyces bekefii]
MGAVAVGYFVSQYNWLSSVQYVVGLFAGVLGLFGWRKGQLVLRTSDTEMVVDCDELANEVCFTIALNALLGAERRNAGEVL